MKFLSKLEPTAYAALRIVSGFLFFCHGAQKILGMFGGFMGQPGNRAPIIGLMGVAGIIELVGGALVAIGFQTRIAAFLSSGQMAVAYFMAHQKNGALPIQNQGELAVLYCFIFLFLATRGSGVLSLDGGKS